MSASLQLVADGGSGSPLSSFYITPVSSKHSTVITTAAIHPPPSPCEGVYNKQTLPRWDLLNQTLQLLPENPCHLRVLGAFSWCVQTASQLPDNKIASP